MHFDFNLIHENENGEIPFVKFSENLRRRFGRGTLG